MEKSGSALAADVTTPKQSTRVGFARIVGVLLSG